MTEQYTLYGMTASLYTAKARAYMRQNNVPFVERKSGSNHFRDNIAEKVGRWIVPVLETPDGELIQDGTGILDYFEQKGASKTSIYPQSDVLRVISHLFELFGSEGLLRPAMHYRWNFDETNLAFLKHSFREALPDGLDEAGRAAMFEFVSGRLHKVKKAFGVTPDTIPTIESSYAEFLSLFDAHLDNQPFLLGGHATIGDYAMFGPLFAHLGRDPKPLHLMQTTAPRIHRWTERMNASELFHDEIFDKAGGVLLQPDAIPDTLLALMRYVADEYLPEITAHVAFANEWLDDRPELKPGESGLDKSSKFGRSIGFAEFDWRGQRISTMVVPYRFYLLQRLKDAYDASSNEDQNSARAIFAKTGLEPILDLTVSRRVMRKNHAEVWGEPISQ